MYNHFAILVFLTHLHKKAGTDALEKQQILRCLSNFLIFLQ